MSTCQDIVTAALREGNLLAAGTTPQTVELTEGLSRLNALIRSFFGNEIGEHLSDWPVPQTLRTAPVAANYPQLPLPTESLVDVLPVPSVSDVGADVFPFPPENSRLVVGITAPTTVWLAEAPNDGARMAFVAAPAMVDTLTVDGNGRLIESASEITLQKSDVSRAWFYRADLAGWVKLTDLALTDLSPLPEDLEDLLVCALNVRLAPRYGQDPRAGTVSQLKYMMKLAKTRYKQRGVTLFGGQNIPESLQSYQTGRWMV